MTIYSFSTDQHDQTSSRHRRLALLGSACLLGLSLTGSAFAQGAEKAKAKDAASKDLVLEEIVVTANKQTQNLRDVSISISAINTDSLNKLGGDKFSEFLTGVAGVSIQDNGSLNQNVVFRGVTASGTDEPSAGVYFDELPSGDANNGIQIKAIDVERFEILRGPQPILYGAGSLTGTLRLIPKRPNLGQAEYGADLGISSINSSKGLGYDVSAYVNVPIVADQLAVRVAGFVERENGFVDNLRLNRKEGDFKSRGGRASIAFAPSETVNLLAQYVYQKNDFDGGGNYRPILSRANPGLGRFQIDKLATLQQNNVHLFGLTTGLEIGAVKLTSVTSYQKIRQSIVRE